MNQNHPYPHSPHVKFVQLNPLVGGPAYALAAAGIDTHGLFRRHGENGTLETRDREFAYVDLAHARIVAPPRSDGGLRESAPHIEQSDLTRLTINGRSMLCQLLTASADRPRLSAALGGAEVSQVRAIVGHSELLDSARYAAAAPAFVEGGSLTIVSHATLTELESELQRRGLGHIDPLQIVKPNLVLHIPELGRHWEHCVEAVQIGGSSGPVIRLVEPNVLDPDAPFNQPFRRQLHEVLDASLTKSATLRDAGCGELASCGVRAAVEWAGVGCVHYGDEVRVKRRGPKFQILNKAR